MDTTREQQLLRLSISVTLLVGLAGIAFGLWIRSQSIVFDGFYSVVDVAMTAVALIVSKLVSREGSRRFQFGYWHLEPIVAAFNGIVLSLACAYAFIDATRGLLSGGHLIDFGPGAFYALVTSIVSLAMCVFMRRRASELDSELLRIDSRGWLVGGALSIALAVSFLAASLLSGSRYAALAPYADPFVLAILSFALAFVPMRSIAEAVREIMQVAPADLDAQVRRVMAEAMARYGFLTYSSYVIKAGRARFIEIHIVTPPDFGKSGVAELDAIRQEIGDRLGEPGPQRWLTIAFTARPEWI